MSTFPETSTTLLAKLAARETGIDQAAWRIFFDRYQPVMVEFARIKGAGDDAEDIVQDVFSDLAKVFRAGRYVRSKGRFRNYLAKMLRNELISRFRHEQVRPEKATPTTKPGKSHDTVPRSNTCFPRPRFRNSRGGFTVNSSPRATTARRWLADSAFPPRRCARSNRVSRA